MVDRQVYERVWGQQLCPLIFLIYDTSQDLWQWCLGRFYRFGFDLDEGLAFRVSGVWDCLGWILNSESSY